MLNIKVQCCGLVLLGLITYFYWRLPKMAVRTKKQFSIVIIISDICIFTDILSVIAIYKADVLPDILVRASCKLYLAFLLGMIYCGLMYICSDICKNDAEFKKKRVVYGIFMGITICVMCALPIEYVCEQDGNVVYSQGPATIVAYVFFVAMFVAMVVHMYINKDRINPRRISAVRFWLVVWFLSAGWQFLDSTMLVVSFAGCLGIIIIFAMIENPELTLDKDSNFFHTNAMIQYISELYANGRKFILVCTNFHKKNMDFYKEIENAHIFVGGGEIYFLFADREDGEKLVDRLTTEFYRQHIYAVWDSSVASSSESLFSYLKEAQRIRKWEQHTDICVLDHELIHKLEERKQTEKLIREAIDHDRVEVFYQPIYSIEEGRFHSAEALMRIRDGDGKLISPGVFIPVAEDEGSILELGRILFDKVCSFLKQNGQGVPLVNYVEVNLSVVQGEDKHLADDVMTTMKKYGIGTDMINLEITESASITGKKQLLSTMETLESYGITFSLDDFGTGQSNLDYMASMPVQIVKFDHSMTSSYFTSEKMRSVMNAAISMIHEMGMKIVAEGIETKEQFECMKERGIDYIQGYYFSRPLPERDFVEFIMKDNAKLK